VEIRIEDDGVGFDPSSAGGGLGLRGIFERARILGGRATIRSSPGHGTSLVVQVPGQHEAASAHPPAAASVDVSKQGS
jgi:signal transduction histidine kinase